MKDRLSMKMSHSVRTLHGGHTDDIFQVKNETVDSDKVRSSVRDSKLS